MLLYIAAFVVIVTKASTNSLLQVLIPSKGMWQNGREVQ